MRNLTAITIVVDYPSGYTVAGAMLADSGPFDDAQPLIDAVRAALGSSWCPATADDVRAHYAERYSGWPNALDRIWEQLTLF